MGITVVASIISAAVAVKGAVDQKKAAGEAKHQAAVSAAEQRKQFDSQQRIADIKNARERAQLARQRRIQRGAVAATASNTNTSDSSGAIGGLASIDTQAATNLGNFGSVQQNQKDIVDSQGRQGTAEAGKIQAQADISSGQALFNVGSSVFGATGGFKTIFDAIPSSNPAAGPDNSAYHGSFGE